MLDTDTCIHTRKRSPGFAPRLSLEHCGVSVIVVGELEWGVSRSRRIEENQAALRDWLVSVQVVELDARVAREYGRLRRTCAPSASPSAPMTCGSPLTPWPGTCP